MLLEEKLLETGGRFQVIDRSHMGAVMSELKLSASDLAQSNNEAVHAAANNPGIQSTT